MNSEELRQRAMMFALRVIAYIKLLPKTFETQVIGKQLLRSATSMAANYRAAGRGRSRAEFIAKLTIVVEETDESLFWLELIYQSGINQTDETAILMKEVKELLYIFSSSKKTARENLKRLPQSPNH